MHRRTFLGTLAAGAWSSASAAAPPLKFGHREASMKMVGNIGVFELASRISGLHGVELQITAGQPLLWDPETLRKYKAEANRWGIRIHSLAAPFPKGVTIRTVDTAPDALRKAIATARFLGASVILLPFFRDNCPSMEDESQYGPVVKMLKQVAPEARDSGVVLGLENSLSPTGNAKLCDLVADPHVRIYYDLYNCEFYEHTGQSVPGVATIGRERICAVHVKNESKLIEEPGKLDWRAALVELKKIGYEGWYTFESSHSSAEQCVSSTARNIAFLRKVLA